MPISSFIADPITQAEIDYRRERAFKQFARRTSHHAHRGHRWGAGRNGSGRSDR
jgi:hypothetical protein